MTRLTEQEQTGVACKKLNMNYFGSEISEAQVLYSIDRIKNI